MCQKWRTYIASTNEGGKAGCLVLHAWGASRAGFSLAGERSTTARMGITKIPVFVSVSALAPASALVPARPPPVSVLFPVPVALSFRVLVSIPAVLVLAAPAATVMPVTACIPVPLSAAVPFLHAPQWQSTCEALPSPQHMQSLLLAPAALAIGLIHKLHHQALGGRAQA